MIKYVFVALVVMGSFWLGQALYLWAREEVDAFRKRFPKSAPWYHQILYASVLGFAQAVATKLQSFEIISLILMIIGLILWSVAYGSRDKKKSIKGLLISSLVFLAVFAAVYLPIVFYLH